MKIAALQTAYLGLSQNKLDYYLKICSRNDVRVLLLGEYVLNRFFKEIEKTPLNMIKEQSAHQLKNLKQLSEKYNITIAAPIVLVQSNKIFKALTIVSPKKNRYYFQQILINYSYWNEDKFFFNEKNILKTPPLFYAEKVKFGVLFGFESHFNYFFDSFIKKRVDVVLIPTASTFESNQRWRELLKTRAFTGNFYILRANRIGDFKEQKGKWEFYGESFFINPDGEIEIALSNKEELLIAEVDKKYLSECKKAWGFRKTVLKRGACG